MNAVIELQEAYAKYSRDPKFMAEVERRNHEYAGRPSPLYFAKRMTEDLGGTKVHIKREDLNHTGSHKINNVIGQCLLAKRMGKTRVIAETGAGQHGVATVTMAAHLGLECEIFVGAEAFCRRCVESGVGYLMVPDLPFEERGELAPLCDSFGVVPVTMVSPTYPERMDRILSSAEGFVYIVRSEDAAGFPEGYVHELPGMAERVHSHGLKCIADSGLGEAGAVLDHVSGAVDGTDVMTLVLRHGRDCVQFVADYARGVSTRIRTIEIKPSGSDSGHSLHLFTPF